MSQNVRWFLWFRVLFNCRFYYPVYAVLFQDFGLDMQAFASLNFLWSMVIVFLDVPAGVLADHFGRRNLVRFASALMVLEMVVLLLCPVGGASVFIWFALNRILSGTAEACASGADEALAYDTLLPEHREHRWPQIMGRLTRWMAIGSIFTTILGGLVYDAKTMTRLWNFLGGTGVLESSLTIKFPLFLNLLTAIACFWVSLRLKEVSYDRDTRPYEGFWLQTKAGALAMWQTAGWIWRSPTVLLLLALGFYLDSVVRVFYTVNSLYFRLISIPDAYFGFIGSAMAVISLLLAHPMERMTRNLSPQWNFAIVQGCMLLGLVGAAMAVPYWGLLLALPLWLSGRFLPFFHSHYINRVSPSARRATILSFRGLSMNLVYGFFALSYGWHYTAVELSMKGKHELDGLSHDDQAKHILSHVISQWPLFFIIGLIALLFLVRLRTRRFASSILREVEVATHE